jgi:hypothetical protein
VQVHYGEGVANHADPESCAAYREVCGEALTGERAGQPLSHVIFLIQDADVVTCAEGKTNGCDNAVPERSCVVGDAGNIILLITKDLCELTSPNVRSSPFREVLHP